MRFLKWLFGCRKNEKIDEKASSSKPDSGIRFFNPNMEPSVDFDTPEFSTRGKNVEVDFMAPEASYDDTIEFHESITPITLPNFNAPCLSFAARVLTYIRVKKLNPPDVYKRGEISRQTYSRIVAADDSRVNKFTAMQFCIGLKLNMRESELLLKTAGYAFSNVLKEDKAFSFCVENKLWDMDHVRMHM